MKAYFGQDRWGFFFFSFINIGGIYIASESMRIIVLLSQFFS